MSSDPVAVASAFASSVLPVPAGPSTSSGLPNRSARNTVVAICASGRYPAVDSRLLTSATEENCGDCVSGRGMRLLGRVAGTGRVAGGRMSGRAGCRGGGPSADVAGTGHDIGGGGQLGQAER